LHNYIKFINNTCNWLLGKTYTSLPDALLFPVPGEAKCRSHLKVQHTERD